MANTVHRSAADYVVPQAIEWKKKTNAVCVVRILLLSSWCNQTYWYVSEMWPIVTRSSITDGKFLGHCSLGYPLTRRGSLRLRV